MICEGQKEPLRWKGERRNIIVLYNAAQYTAWTTLISRNRQLETSEISEKMALF